MKNILLIGVGGTGSRAVDIFYKKAQEFGKQNDNKLTALVFDTDKGDVKEIKTATVIELADNASVGTICDRVGKEYIREWFPCDNPAIRAQEMAKGASQWRKKSYLAFLNAMNSDLKKTTFINALEKMVADPKALCEVYVISSVAGGTGSGSFIPIALFVKRYLRKHLGKDPIVNAMIAMPEIYEASQTQENKIKIFANAYAILRELNAINLVSRGYNAGRTELKKAPIKFRIGNPDEPNVGVLFDAADEQYWTPEAAPFNQIFLLDRIPGLKSPIAHDMVLANSLYSILCTDIGSQFDSELSNHELVRSQNNGGNAIYAGIATSQINFPYESVLEYIANKKTLDSCNSDWVGLHNAVEAKIKESEQLAKEAKRRFTLSNSDYAKLVNDAVEQLEADEADNIVDIITRGTEFEKLQDGKMVVVVNDGSAFLKEIEKRIVEKIPVVKNPADGSNDIETQIKNICSVSKKLPSSQLTQKESRLYGEVILEYYKECVENIKKYTTGLVDAVISLDPAKADLVQNSKLSLVKNLLMANGKYIHPVAALVQLCRFKALLSKGMWDKVQEWSDLKKRTVTDVDASLLMLQKIKTIGGQTVNDVSKSYYYRIDKKDRFVQLHTGQFSIKNKKTNHNADVEALQYDALSIVNNIQDSAYMQIKARVLNRIEKAVDILIAKYRAFFTRFEKEKETLVEATKTAQRKDSENVDSVINVYSSIDEKVAIMDELDKLSGPQTDAEVAKVDDIVGKGVYESVFKSAMAEASGKTNFNDKDTRAFRSLFASMVESYKESIKKSEAFAKIASYNVIEALTASCGDDADLSEKEEAYRTAFSMANELSKPALKVNENGDLKELVRPSLITVYMMSVNTGRYLKMHADELNLPVSANQNNEMDVIKACAQEFINRYSGNSSARVTVVDSLPDHTVYCTGEIMDVTPLRIPKLDELSPDSTYFKHYETALENMVAFDTDMWNPHIGFDLHKRGSLPYMNEEKEKICDEQAAKAIVYALSTGKITCGHETGDVKSVFKYNGSNIETNTNPSTAIGTHNISQLVIWMRNQDNLVKKWGAALDHDVELELRRLPTISSSNSAEIGELERSLTTCKFMKLITGYTPLFTATNGAKASKSYTLFDFAVMVRDCENVTADCDDAERILSAMYKLFMKACTYRTTPTETPNRFMQVYSNAINNFYEVVAASDRIKSKGINCKMEFHKLVSWMNSFKTFMGVPTEIERDAYGNIVMNTEYSYEKPLGSEYNAGQDVLSTLNKIESDAKPAAPVAAPETTEDAPADGEEAPAPKKRGRPSTKNQ